LRYILLLRGVNVGGKRSLPMKDLAALLTGLGCADVRTYIQSGNAVFEAPAPVAAKLPAALRAALQKKFGFDVPVVQRSAAQLKAALKAWPFGKPGAEPKSQNLGFLEARPAAADVARALKEAPLAAGEAFKVIGQEVHLYYPHGLAKTKLTNAYLDSRLKTVCTVRNWNTVAALLELAEA
jgi:uncharacterized protein (DUF1697 family)